MLMKLEKIKNNKAKNKKKHWAASTFETHNQLDWKYHT